MVELKIHPTRILIFLFNNHLPFLLVIIKIYFDFPQADEYHLTLTSPLS